MQSFYILTISLNYMNIFTALNELAGISKLINAAHDYTVCLLCLEDDSKPLNDCLISIPKRSASNPEKHLKARHGLSSDHPATKYWELATVRDKQVPFDVSSMNDKNTVGDLFKIQSQKEAIDGFHRLAHRFVSRCGIPFRSANSIEFHDMCKYLVVHGEKLRAQSQKLKMGEYKYREMSNIRFTEMIYVVSEMVNITRQWLSQNAGKNIPFVTVSHDIWVAKTFEVLGVSIFFVFPHTWEDVSFPIALIRSDTKVAVDVTKEINTALNK
jgi:hypothetical protein